MLAIRMQRTGRKGYAQFRIVVQDTRQTPSSARVVASIGNYNPHTKEAVIDTEKAKFYLKNGAQPSGRVISLLKKEGVKLPSWAQPAAKQKKAIKNQDKLRKNRPSTAKATEGKPVGVEPKKEKPVEPSEPEEPVEEIVEETKAAEPVDAPKEAESTEEKSSKEEKAEETPKETSKEKPSPETPDTDVKPEVPPAEETPPDTKSTKAKKPKES
jgi:small subunit ribosomal protein S16